MIDIVSVTRHPRTGVAVAVVACDSLETKQDVFDLVAGFDWSGWSAADVPGREIFVYYRRDHVPAHAWICHAADFGAGWRYSFDNDPADRLAFWESLQ